MSWNGKTHLLTTVVPKSYASYAAAAADTNVEAGGESAGTVSPTPGAAGTGTATATASSSSASASSNAAKLSSVAAAREEGHRIANHLAAWLRAEFNGRVKASALGAFYKANPASARTIRAVTLGQFCFANSDILDFSQSAHVIGVWPHVVLDPVTLPGELMPAATKGGSVTRGQHHHQHQQQQKPPSPQLAVLDDATYALCALRTWLLEQGGKASVGSMTAFSARSRKAHSTVTAMGLHNFVQRFPDWIALDSGAQEIVLAELSLARSQMKRNL